MMKNHCDTGYVKKMIRKKAVAEVGKCKHIRLNTRQQY